jgi:endonuclease/exonuclease/phosphatase family metal-dependent hydrolase
MHLGSNRLGVRFACAARALWLAVAALTLTTAKGQGAVLLSDSFDYTNGPLVTVSGGRWITHSGTVTGEVQVAGGRVALSEEDSEDVSALLAGQPYPAANATNVFYAGLTVRFTSLPTAGGAYFAHFKDAGGSGFRARVWAFAGGATPGALRLGVSSTSGTTISATNATELFPHTDYRVVVRLATTNSVATLWVDPASDTDYAVSTSEGPAAATVAAFALRQSGGEGALEVDDVRVGTTFAAALGAPLPPRPATVSLLTYNVSGNGATDWSTNSPQVQAIGRQMVHLRPDIITFNEIPNAYVWEMTNFVAAFLPGYFLATNSGTDGFLRSVIASRFPIARSQSRLDNEPLAPFGYTNQNPWFTRDLFEAEIAVPGFSQRLHVFTTHLKAGTDSNDLARRAAEASAISNFLVTIFLPAHALRPYVLAGDLNEDIARPPGGSRQPVQRLVNAATGLQLTTPRNPVTADDRTIASDSLFARFDYILPGGLLFANIASSQVFRTDVLIPLPAGVLANDSRTASDHLPVLMTFRNPFDAPFRVTAITVSNALVRLDWQTIAGSTYRAEASSDLAAWTPASVDLLATSNSLTWTTNQPGDGKFLRVRRVR